MTKEEKSEYYKKWYQKNKEKHLEQMKLYNKLYNQTPMGRALRLLSAYNLNDKKYDRGKGNLTAKWIVENIFSKSCVYCGKEGWEVIGCNRIDNSKPHTKDNVEPCCLECNVKLAAEENKTNFINRQDLAKQVYQYTLDGKLVRVWASTAECGRNGYSQSAVAACCRGERQTYKGYIWSYAPL